MGFAQIYKGDEYMNLYCKLNNGTMIPKYRVDNAIDLIEQLKGGFSVVEMSDIDLFTKGDLVDAVRRFREKYDTLLVEAKAAIDFLREE